MQKKRIKMKRLILTSLCVLFVAGTASGNTPYKWFQPPDLTATGIDVDSTSPGKLADDFECTQTGYITGVHIWGSWKEDDLPFADANRVGFTLKIYSDIPDPDGDGSLYSMPNDVLWERSFEPGDFTVQKYADVLEGWYDPITGDYSSEDHYGVWQYSFIAPPGDLFYQEGTPDNPVVYWLGVEADPQDHGGVFGWKTSSIQWNDDAVYDRPAWSWEELRFPDGQSLDLAFAIVPEPATMTLLGLGMLALLRKRRV